MTDPAEPVVTIDTIATALAEGIVAALPSWVVRSVERVVAAAGVARPAEVRARVRADAEVAGAQAAAEVGAAVRALLAADVDEQRTTPLALLRGAVRYPTAVLRRAGVEPLGRDRYAEEAFPDDPYDLTPANFADVDPSLAEPGLLWGAAKAWEHKRRHGGRP